MIVLTVLLLRMVFSLSIVIAVLKLARSRLTSSLQKLMTELTVLLLQMMFDL